MITLITLNSRSRNQLFFGLKSDELPIAAIAEQKLWTSPNRKTPHATLREIGSKAGKARFKKVGRGLFAFNAGGK